MQLEQRQHNARAMLAPADGASAPEAPASLRKGRKLDRMIGRMR